MTHTKLLKKLHNEDYRSWPVTEAIKPDIEYHIYAEVAVANCDLELVVAFGSESGKTLPAADCYTVTICEKKWFFHRKDVFVCSRDNAQKPSDCLVCIDRQGEVHAPEHMVEAHDYRGLHYTDWQPRIKCTQLDEELYGPDKFAVYSDTVTTVRDETVLRCHSVYVENTGDYYHQDDCDDLYFSDTRDYWLDIENCDNVVFCEDIQEWLLEEDAHYDSHNEEWNYERPRLDPNDRSRLQEYHCGIRPDMYVTDNVEQPRRGLLNYTIGFEVEKRVIEGSENAGAYITHQPLFSHWETDSSCGVEGITNVYSLDNFDRFKRHVDSSHYTDNATTSDCGGHINFASRFNKMEYWHIRPWLGLFYAMFKKRLRNTYSSRNKKVSPYEGRSHNYGVLVEKTARTGKLFELRLPNRVRTGQTLLNRFKMMQHLVTCIDAYIHEDFAYTQAKYSDQHTGLPDWLLASSGLVPDWIIQDAAQLLNEISPQTAQRVRYLFEQAKDTMLQFYTHEELAEVLVYAYAFQHYIDEEDTTTTAQRLVAQYI